MPRIRSWKDFINLPGFRSALRGTLRYWFGKRGQRLVYGLRIFYRLRMNVLLRTGDPIGKIARRNDVRLWVDGEESFERLEKLIRRAQHHIVVQMFIWKNDATGRRIAELLLEAADRGVNIDITKEAVGDFFEFHGDFLGTKDSSQHPWPAFWNHKKIRISYSTNNDHAKVFVIDGYILLLTGMNIADEYRYRWHDYMVELRGAQFVEQFLTGSKPEKQTGDVQLVMNSQTIKDIRPVLMNLLKNVREHLVVEHCYVSDPEVMQELIRLSKAGVRMTILLPKWVDFHYHANMTSIGHLLSEGDSSFMTVLIYHSMFHAKVIIADHESIFIGSMNLFKGSIDEMGEVNVLIRNKYRVLWKLKEALRSNILKSRSISSPPTFLWLSRWLAWLGL